MGLFDSNIKNLSIAEKISITSPYMFRKSIDKLKQNGLTLHEYKGLVLAQNRAKAILKRKDLSEMERKQMREIGEIKLPNWREV